MKLSTLMIINTTVAAVFGLAFIIAPAPALSLYGVTPNPELNFVAQLFGATLVAFAILTWSARNLPPSEARKSIVLALFVGDGIGFIVALIAQLGGVVNLLGWSTVAIYLILSLGFGYFRFFKE